jgi:hypothetical protein
MDACLADWTSPSCASYMQTFCQQGDWVAKQGESVFVSRLLNPASPCFQWQNQMFSSGADTAPLETAMKGYCSGVGATRPECQCLNFPENAQPYCSSASGCRTDVCSAQVLQTMENGALTTVQWPSCQPYVCWFSPCSQPSTV